MSELGQAFVQAAVLLVSGDDVLWSIIGVSFSVSLRAMALAFLRLKIVLEPGGAVALAAALFHPGAVSGDSVIAVATGGNVDPDTFALALKTCARNVPQGMENL